MWYEIRSLVAAQTDARCGYELGGGVQPYRARYRITDVDIGPYMAEFTAVDLLRIRQLAARGVCVSPVRIFGRERGEKFCTAVIPMMYQLFKSKTAGFPVKGIFRAPTKIDPWWIEDFKSMDCVFSVLLDSESIQDVALPSLSYERSWQWMATVLFSWRASNVIEKVTMSVSRLSLIDVAALESTLNAVDPLATLFPPVLGGGDREMRTVDVSKFRFLPPSSNTSGASQAAFGLTLKNLPVLDEDTDWLIVLVPGWGKAWVKRKHATNMKTTLRPAPAPIQPTRHFVFNKLSKCDEPAFVALCRAIGHGVRKITNPHLEEFELQTVWWESLQRIALAYEAGICRVKKLVLQLDSLADFQNVHRFSGRLADVNHPMTKHLRVLHFTYKDSYHSRYLPNIKSAVLRMLHHNRSIYEFYFDMPLKQRIIDGLRLSEPVAQEEFDCCNGELVFEQLALRNKLAFLSVVEPNQSAQTAGGSSGTLGFQNVIHRLDASVVTTIFQFAGDSRERWVRVQF